VFGREADDNSAASQVFQRDNNRVLADFKAGRRHLLFCKAGEETEIRVCISFPRLAGNLCRMVTRFLEQHDEKSTGVAACKVRQRWLVYMQFGNAIHKTCLITSTSDRQQTDM